MNVLPNMIEPEEIHYIDTDMMEKMCHPIAMAIFDSDEDPMTAFNEHEKALLESALGNPRQSFYKTVYEKAAILYYGLIKNHPFRNGNKRTATAAFLVFLDINDREIAGEKKEIEDYLVILAKRVAASIGSADKDKFLSEIRQWLEKHTS